MDSAICGVFFDGDYLDVLKMCRKCVLIVYRMKNDFIISGKMDVFVVIGS